MWLLSLSHGLAIELSPVFPPETNGKANKESKRWLGTDLPFFFFTHPELAVSRHVCVYNILFCTLGFTSGIWLLSSWSSPCFVPIRMRHTCGYLLSPDVEGIWIVLSQVPSGNPTFCCPVWISLFHFSF